MSKGVFISFEGVDGAGKSTHIQVMADTFRQQGRSVTLTREPGGTPLAEKLRQLVLNDAMDPLTEALLMFAARRNHIQEVILPALSRGDVVLCDRFTDATFAYQGHGRGFDLAVLSQLEQWVQGGDAHGELLQPDMTLWFALDPAIAAQRLADARLPDRFESQPLAFFAQVHAGYQARAEAAPGRMVRIDAGQSRHQVWQQLIQALVRRGWLSIMVATPPAMNAP
jgi:dTMP kinase